MTDMEMEREDRIKKAQTYARWKAKVLKAQGYERPWGIAITEAARKLCGNFPLYEFQKELGRRFRAAYKAKVANNKQLQLQGT